VERTGRSVDRSLLGTRVIGDTFIGCGRCARCHSGRTSTCATRREIGVRGWDGAFAELLVVPAANALRVPDELDDAGAALVEPLSNAVRAVAEVPRDARTLLIRGAGTLGILAARVAALRGLAAVVVDGDPAAAARASTVGCRAVAAIPAGESFDAVIEMAASADPSELLPAVEDGGVIVVTGFPASTATLPIRTLVERDLRVVGTLGAPSHLHRAIRVAAETGVGELAGRPRGLDDLLPHLLRAPAQVDAVKFQIDPRLDHSSASLP
jgi:threonine dehydrogenase-like Zn-dependent dehydrogenase